MSRFSAKINTIASCRQLLYTPFLSSAKSTPSFSDAHRGLSSDTRQKSSGSQSKFFNLLAKENIGGDFETVLKIVQRFRKQPHEWPKEDQPFGIIERTFVGKMMHPIELRPERGFVNMVPFGLMVIRHLFRKARAKVNFTLFQSSGIFNEKDVREGVKRVFEVISQHVYKNNMRKLVTDSLCDESLVRRFESASCHMSHRQRSLLNLSEKDIFAIAPGVLGPFQLIRPMLRNKEPFISYSLLCCAFYKKQMLFDAVSNLPLIENGDEADCIPIPNDYGYAAPRLVFAFTTFGNKIIGRREVGYGQCSSTLLAVAQHIRKKRTSIPRRPLYLVCRQFSTNSTEEGEFSDICSLAKVWNRAPLPPQNNYPADQKAFSLTRDSNETTSKYQNELCFKEENNLVLTECKEVDIWTKTLAYIKWLKTKLFILGTATTFVMNDEDLVRGGQKVFRTILDAVTKRKVESLGPLMLRRSALDVHRKSVWSLNQKQMSALMVTDADFVGRNGFVYNWDGFGTERGTISRMIHSATIEPKDPTGELLDQPYFRYSIILCALLHKNELYKMVRQLPFKLEEEQKLFRMPPNYGFVAPRYVVMRIDMCHQVINAAPLQLSEDGLIYDFHIHSF